MFNTERRVKAFRVCTADVLTWLQIAADGMPRYLQLPRLTGLPPGATVLAVCTDTMRGTFEFLVTHPSFPEVPEGEMPPEADDGRPATWDVVALVRAADAPTGPGPSEGAPMFVIQR